ncbi:MAG: ABC transporter ATP-binding protein [Gammaproteobacteria bacterium]
MSAVELRDVVFGWGRGEPLLQIDALDIAPGERVFISGPSGSGKSTLLGLIGGVLTATSGTVRVLGESLGDIGAARRDALRVDRIGFIFQMFNLLPYLSVRDNVALPCRFSARRRARALTEATDIRTEAERLLSHLGLDDPALLDRRVTELSIGQQQRVAAARALIGRPELLIADEPTSSLDADARAEFLSLLMSECTAAGSAIVFVSHDRSLASQFDRQVDLLALNRLARRQAA